MTDNLGSVRDVVDATGAVIDHLVYNSFGQVASETNPSAPHLQGYAGGIVDPATGLVNFWHRWYDPATGNWISEDPTGFEAGDANLSRYVGNSTSSQLDPSGYIDVAIDLPDPAAVPAIAPPDLSDLVSPPRPIKPTSPFYVPFTYPNWATLPAEGFFSKPPTPKLPKTTSQVIIIIPAAVSAEVSQILQDARNSTTDVSHWIVIPKADSNFTGDSTKAAVIGMYQKIAEPLTPEKLSEYNQMLQELEDIEKDTKNGTVTP